MSAEVIERDTVKRQITHVVFDLDGLLLGMCVGERLRHEWQDWRGAKPIMFHILGIFV